MSNTYPDNYVNKLSIVLHSFLLKLMFLSCLSLKDDICLAHIPSLFRKTFCSSKARFLTCGVVSASALRQLYRSEILLQDLFSLLTKHQLRRFQMCGVQGQLKS